VARAGDCDDSDEQVNPDGLEVCDGVDNDCDDAVDSADPSVDPTTEHPYYRDSDGDGFGDASNAITSCDKPGGYVADATDCDDADRWANPGAPEVCDEVDNDCDELTDDDDDSLDVSTAGTFYLDEDGDGFGGGVPVTACSAPAQHVTTAGDCDDAAADTNPDASETCNGRDNDCDGGADGTVAAPDQCDALVGAYAGSYEISAVERLGATIINSMTCTGTSSVELDLAQNPALQGTVSCSYPGGLVAFDSVQSGTISASVGLDGTVDGTVTHVYASGLTRTYSLDGSIAGGVMDADGLGTLTPNPMSVVPWEVDFAVSAVR
jgi:hypothetical protein